MAFELVQRLTDAPNGRPRNIFGDPASLRVSELLLSAGAGVDLDYMGAYEYADPRTLYGSANRIANAASLLRVVARESVSFICTGTQAEALLPQWDSWEQDQRARTGYQNGAHNPFTDTVGWWALHEDLIWTRRADVAESIRGAFVTIAEAAQATAD